LVRVEQAHLRLQTGQILFFLPLLQLVAVEVRQILTVLPLITVNLVALAAALGRLSGVGVVEALELRIKAMLGALLLGALQQQTMNLALVVVALVLLAQALQAQGLALLAVLVLLLLSQVHL
jgi:hypothetical protein